jgi:hypothetical protein
MLVVFRQRLERLDAMLVADRGEVREQGDRCIVRAQLLLDEGEIEHRAIQQVIPQAATDGLAIQVSRALEVSRLLDPSASDMNSVAWRSSAAPDSRNAHGTMR